MMNDKKNTNCQNPPNKRRQSVYKANGTNNAFNSGLYPFQIYLKTIFQLNSKTLISERKFQLRNEYNCLVNKNRVHTF